ncbi:hypothetical protein C8J98_102149 [Luteibacter sp. OK325]|jgi:hypothetical protein|uniref:hypothetical protein n=1 Tax=Luteibacter sp. OK325 TaxID=2135670 RepID=UPI000D3734C7|nr:hypothetical protein [Luteibacter sp. OK325]PTR33962.1 hypothetical protein C8J98_102149 [Luteibacter sp. OK325]
MTSETLMPAVVATPTNRQRAYVRYVTAILIDLVVLNLFAEYWKNVFIDTFTTSLLAAIVLQVLLKLTMALEHKIGAFFKARPGRLNTGLRFFFAWLVLFGSKFVILEAIAQMFGEDVRFLGAFHGVVALIVVIVAMLAAEEVFVRIYRKLGDHTTTAESGASREQAL